MKYFATSLLIAGAAAQSFDAATAVNSLITATNSLTEDVNNYSGGAGADLQAAAKQLVTEITTDDTEVKASAMLTQDQALALAGPVQNLGTAAKAAVDAIVAKKATFVASGQGAAVYSALSAQQSASDQFSTDLTSKVPQALQGIAANLAQPIASALSSGVSAFADVATASGSTGSSAASSAATSSSSGSAATSAVVSSSSSAAESSSAAATTESSSAAATTSAASSSAAATTAAASSSAAASSAAAPVATGAANTVVVGSGVGALAFLLALAL